MADYEGALPTKTVRDDEFKIKIVDFSSGEIATAGLKIEADGSVNTNTKITDGTNDLVVNADGSLNAVVTASDLDIRDLTAASDSVSIKNGANTLAVNADGSINTGIPGVEVLDYGSSTAVAANASANFDYLVTNTKVFKNAVVTVGARGAVKVEIGTSADGGTTFDVKKTVFQLPADNKTIECPGLKLTGDGTAIVRVKVTNNDKAASDIYCTIEAREV